MTLLVQCSACNRKFRAKDAARGKKTKCPGCAEQLLIEGSPIPDFDCFVSYSTPDQATADSIVQSLESRNLRCWIAPRNIQAGVTWASAILNAIEECPVMVLVYSSHADRSRQVLREVERAVSKGHVIIPFRVEDCRMSRELEYFLSSTHWLDATRGDLSKSIVLLANTVRAIVDNTSPETTAHYTPKTVKKRSFHYLWVAFALAGLAISAIAFPSVKKLIQSDPQAVATADSLEPQVDATVLLSAEIKRHIDPASWQQPELSSSAEDSQTADGSAASADSASKPYITVGNGELTISAALQTHRKIDSFLTSKRLARHLALPALLPIEEGYRFFGYEPLGVRKVLNELDNPTMFEFIETPLSDVADYLSELHAIKVTLDTGALANLGLGNDLAITAEIKGVSLSESLQRVLSPYELAYVVREDGLLITDTLIAEATVFPLIYDVRDLVSENGGTQVDPDAVREEIIHPEDAQTAIERERQRLVRLQLLTVQRRADEQLITAIELYSDKPQEAVTHLLLFCNNIRREREVPAEVQLIVMDRILPELDEAQLRVASYNELRNSPGNSSTSPKSQKSSQDSQGTAAEVGPDKATPSTAKPGQEPSSPDLPDADDGRFLAEVEQRNEVIRQMIINETDETIVASLRSLNSDPGAAVVSLELIAEQIRRAPELDADTRTRLLKRIDSHHFEAKWRLEVQ